MQVEYRPNLPYLVTQIGKTRFWNVRYFYTIANMVIYNIDVCNKNRNVISRVTLIHTRINIYRALYWLNLYFIKSRFFMLPVLNE